MSKMQELYKKVAGDITLQEKFNQILSEAEAAVKEATEAKLLSFAREAGHEVSLEEMRIFFEGMATQAGGELSDAELDQVAGGKSVNGSLKVVLSVVSVGVLCAVISIVEGTKGPEHCDRLYQ